MFISNKRLKFKHILLFLITLCLCAGGATYFFSSTQVEAQNAGLISSSQDKYTQSQAHMSLPDIKKLISQIYDIKKYDYIVSAALANEEKYKDDYYVFYHGTDSVWRLAQDLYTQLYAHYFPEKLDKSVKDFIFLRFTKDFLTVSPKDFLLAELKKSGLINDHGKMGEILLAVNLALFGNVGTPSECSWEYFIKSRGHANPSRATYEQIMNSFGLSHKYINELMSLVKLYETKEQMLIQIFIPKNLVDEIGYLAWIRGVPADADVMEWVLSGVRSKRFPKTQQSLDALTALFKKEQEKEPLFTKLIKEVEAGQFGLNSFLRIYRNNPETIKNINMMMARLIFTPKVLLNPQSGVKIFRYSTATTKQLQHYYEQLHGVISKILSEKSSL